MQKQLFQQLPYSLGRGAKQTPLPSKSCYLFSSPHCTLTWQQVEVCKAFPPLWEQTDPILRAAKFMECSEITSLELRANFQAALPQKGRAKGRSSGLEQEDTGSSSLCRTFMCMNWATGAETGWSRQGFRQEAALGEHELISLLNPSLNGHRLEGILKEAKRQALHCLIPMALDFQRNLSMQKDFYSTEAMCSQRSPFLMPFFHLPNPFLPIAEPRVFPETKASVKKDSSSIQPVFSSLRFGHASDSPFQQKP